MAVNSFERPNPVSDRAPKVIIVLPFISAAQDSQFGLKQLMLALINEHFLTKNQTRPPHWRTTRTALFIICKLEMTKNLNGET
jgi:hypothetical protein